jgi:formate hydrogenlyase transcriptional activator
MSGLLPLTSHRRAMLRIHRAASRHREPDALFRALAAELRSVTGSPAVALAHCDDLGETLRWFALDPEDPGSPVSPRLQWTDSIFRRVCKEQRPSVIDLSGLEDSREESLDFLRRLGVASACLLPLSTAYRRLGVIGISSRAPQFFSNSAVRFLIPLAGQVAHAMDYALANRERQRLEKETLRLRLLLDLSNAIISRIDSARLTQEIFPRIRHLAEIDAVALILPDTLDHSLHVRMVDFPEQTGRSYPSDEVLPRDSIAGKVFRSGKYWTGNPFLVYGDAGNKLARERGFRSVCVFPLTGEKKALGVLGLGRLDDEPFASEDVEFLEKVANQIAIAVSTTPLAQESQAFKASARHTLSLSAANRGEQIVFGDIVGKSPALQKVLSRLHTVAPAPTTVLISGETGTGKELLAEAIHQLGAQRNGPLIRVNCTALPSGLLESELFGHERGAFTGAIAQRIGRFELANHGTLFLDEISELPLELQPKLLRVLQERQFERIGSSRTLHTNARIIVATNRDLKTMVAEKRFRADLFYRLNAFPLHLPPLRERREDIPLLVEHFSRHFARVLAKEIESVSQEIMELLCRYDWPGNVRELQNVIERAVLLSPGKTLHVPLTDLDIGHPSAEESLEEIERRRIQSVLENTGWVLSGSGGAAARLGMKRSTLQFRMKKLGIVRPRQSR